MLGSIWAAGGQECNGGEFMSEWRELTNCVWGKRACQGAGREFLHLSVIGPYPWDARALFSYGAGCGRPGRWRCALGRRHHVLLPPAGRSDLACGRPLTAPHRRPSAIARLCCPPPASARILAFFEQPCPLQRGFGQQSWLIPNFQPNSATAQDYPRYFQIEKKDSFWRGCLHHPAPVRIPACLPALPLPDLPCGLDRNRPKTALVRLKFSASVQCVGESWALELAGERRLLRQDFVWTDLRNNPWVLLAEVSTIQTTTTLVLYQSI